MLTFFENPQFHDTRFRRDDGGMPDTRHKNVGARLGGDQERTSMPVSSMPISILLRWASCSGRTPTDCSGSSTEMRTYWLTAMGDRSPTDPAQVNGLLIEAMMTEKAMQLYPMYRCTFMPMSQGRRRDEDHSHGPDDGPCCVGRSRQGQLTMDAAVQTALQRNQTLLGAQYDRDAARWGRLNADHEFPAEGRISGGVTRIDPASERRANAAVDFIKLAAGTVRDPAGSAVRDQTVRVSRHVRRRYHRGAADLQRRG